LSKPAQYAAVLLLAYFVAWRVAYVFVVFRAVNHLDFTFYLQWLVLAWTFHGFEMVALTWVLSIVAFIPLAIISVILMKRFRLA